MKPPRSPPLARSRSSVTTSACQRTSSTSKPPFSRRGTRRSESTPVPSTIASLNSSRSPWIANQAGRTVTAAMRSGPATVAAMNHLDRTRWRYSRRMTAITLCHIYAVPKWVSPSEEADRGQSAIPVSTTTSSPAWRTKISCRRGSMRSKRSILAPEATARFKMC